MGIMTVRTLRNQMKSVCPHADSHRVSFDDDDKIKLCWVYDGGDSAYTLMLSIEQINTACRVFERKMHEAKQYLQQERGNYE